LVSLDLIRNVESIAGYRPVNPTSPLLLQFLASVAEFERIIATTNGRSRKTTTDGFGRTTKTELTDTSGNVQTVTDVQYAACGCSPLGKIKQESMPHGPNATVYWKIYNYDGLGRTTSVVAPDGASTTTYSYAGNTVTIQDPAGHSKTFTMDAFGNLTKVNETDPQLGAVSTAYSYDLMNHLTNVSMTRGTATQTRTFNYANNNVVGPYLLSATNPENGTVSYGYNSDGTLAWKQDAKGQKISYSYDQYGRLTQVIQSLPTDQNGNAITLRTYTYDSNSADPNYSYNALGRLTTVQYSVSAPWSAYDNATSRNFTATGYTITEMYNYSKAGQLLGKRLRLVTGPDDGGRTATDDVNASWSYDTEGRLTGITYPADSNYLSTTGPAPAYTYTYNGLGQLSGMTDNNNSN
jgi:YD repeat-containing protein